MSGFSDEKKSPLSLFSLVESRNKESGFIFAIGKLKVLSNISVFPLDAEGNNKEAYLKRENSIKADAPQARVKR